MKQTRRMSLIESIANVTIGFGVAVIATAAILPIFNLRPPARDTLVIASLFTVISIGRSYAVRRLFEALRERQQKRTERNKYRDDLQGLGGW